jgi:DNA (cytosine-5)-methyltransferase 1
MLRIIRSVRPSFVLVENVAALRSRGLNVVLADLAASGFDAEWDCLPAAAFGADHLRDRLFIVAYAKRLRWDHRASVFPPVTAGQPGPRPPTKDHRLVEVVGRRSRAYPTDLRIDDGIASAVDRIKGCGNAVHPDVAEWIGRKIVQFARLSDHPRRPFERRSKRAPRSARAPFGMRSRRPQPHAQARAADNSL